jgi:hypothetical protein
MSYRNPFVTSLLYTSGREFIPQIQAALSVHFSGIERHGDYFCGLHSRSYPGALVAEELEQLADSLRSNGVMCKFSIAFAGEEDEDNVLFKYDNGAHEVSIYKK